MENQIHTQEQQSNLVNADNEQDLSYWSKEFGIAKEELLTLIKRAGSLTGALENYVQHLNFAL